MQIYVLTGQSKVNPKPQFVFWIFKKEHFQYHEISIVAGLYHLIGSSRLNYTASYLFLSYQSFERFGANLCLVLYSIHREKFTEEHKYLLQ